MTKTERYGLPGAAGACVAVMLCIDGARAQDQAQAHAQIQTQIQAQTLAQTLGGPDEETFDFALPSGALRRSLKRFSDQTGVSLIFDHRIVSQKAAPALTGALTPRDALSVLLSGSALEYREIGAGTLALVQTPSADEVHAPPPVALIERPAGPRVDEIIVTASYRAPSVAPGPGAAYAIDRESLELAGAQNVAEPILQLPATVASVSAANTALMVSAGGLNLADLRGLEPFRTLVLVNGRRFVRTSGGNGPIYGVDLNAIPTALVERVEVVNQGAGTTLGTDAVAGAINLVMREHIDGAAFDATGGISGRGDAAAYSISGFAGTVFAGGRGRVSGGAVYAADPSLKFTDRDYLDAPYGFGADGRVTGPADGAFGKGYGGSPITPAGAVTGAVTADGEAKFLLDSFEQLALSPDGAGFEPYEGRLDQRYNWLEGYSALPQIDRVHGYGKMDFDATSRVALYAEFFASAVETHGGVAAAPVTAMRGADLDTGDGLVVPADHPDAPAGLREAMEARVGAPIESFVIARRFAELGPRTRDIGRRTYHAAAGLDVDLGGEWAFDLDVQYGRARVRDEAGGLVDADRIAAALDPALCAQTPGCLPLNVFAADAVAPETAAWYRVDGRRRRLTTTEAGAGAGLSGPIYSVGEQKGRVYGGVSYRRDTLSSRSPASQAGLRVLSDFDMPDREGAVGYMEAVAGADLPLLAGLPGVEALALGLDGRATRWTGGGFIGNVGADLAWKPIRGLELYAHALRGGRAPNAVEMYLAGPDFAEYMSDPCAPPPDLAIANCASPGPLGVPADAKAAAGLVRSVALGDPGLDAERVRAQHFGVAADLHEIFRFPDSADLLRVTADWRTHRIEDRVSIQNAWEVLSACYYSEGLSDYFCGTSPVSGEPFIRRNPDTGRLAHVERVVGNGGETRASGLDAGLSYQKGLSFAPLSPVFSLNVIYSYTHKMLSRGLMEAAPRNLRGLAGFPKHQLFATTSLETERFKTLWTVRRRGAAVTTKDAAVAEARLPATTYVDAGLQFRPTPAAIVYAGVENVFDRKAPVAAFSEDFYAEFYDPVGRRFFAGVKAQF